MAAGPNRAPEQVNMDPIEARVQWLDRGAALVNRETELRERLASFPTGISENNPEKALIQTELSQISTELNTLATQFAESKVKNPSHTGRIERIKARFLDRARSRQYTTYERPLEDEAFEEEKVERKDRKEIQKETRRQTREIDKEVSIKEVQEQTPAMAAQALLEHHPTLMPSDLLSGERQMEAIRTAFPASIAQVLIQELSNPNAPEYSGVKKELELKVTKIQPAYDELSKIYTAQEQLERASIEGYALNKIGKIAKEVSKNPMSLGLLAAGVALLGYVGYKGYKAMGDTGKNVLLGILGGGAGLFGLNMMMDKAKGNNVSPLDWLESKLGIHLDEPFTGHKLDEVRQLIAQNIPSEDGDAVDDFIRIMDASTETVADTFEKALRSGKKEMDSRAFLGKGLKFSEFREVDDGSLYTASEWFFMECGEKYRVENKKPAYSDKKEQLINGLSYARKNYKGHKLGTALVSMEVEKKLTEEHQKSTKQIEQKGHPSVSREKDPITDTNLMKLCAAEPALTEALVSTKHANEYLLKGLPVRFTPRQDGVYEFEDRTGGSSITVSGEGVDLQSSVRALVGEAELRAKTALIALKADETLLSYNDNGYWEYQPGLKANAHAGLPTYTKKEIPLRFVVENNKFLVGLDLAPQKDGAEKIYPSILEAKNGYDKEQGLPDVVKANLDHLLLDLPFTVEDIKDGTNESTLTIRYGSNHKGTLIFKNDTIGTGGIKLEEDAALEATWKKAAQEKTNTFFSDSDYQDWIIQAIGPQPELRWTSTKPDIPFTGDLLGMASKSFSDALDSITDSDIEERFKESKQAHVVKGLRDLRKRMETGYVTGLYKKNLTKEEFLATEQTVTEGYETELNALLEGFDPILTDEDLLTKKTEADDAIEEALDPMDKWSLDTAQRALYTDALAHWQQAAANAIDALGHGPNPKNSAVNAAISNVVNEASKEATAHRGSTPEASKEAFVKEMLTGKNAAEWEAPLEKVYGHLSSYKWEQLAILPKNNNLIEVLKVFVQKINAGDDLPDTTNTPEEYADYFISEVYILFGGHEDVSLDKLYSGINSIADSDFQSKKAALVSIKSYEEWKKHPEKRSATPDLNREYRDSQEKDMILDGFMKDFDDKLAILEANPTNNLFWDHNWPEYWKGSVERRARWILAQNADDPAYTPSRYTADLKTFRQFVTLERNFTELLIQHRIEPKHKGFEFENMAMDEAFKEAWPSSDFKGYYEALQKKIVKNDDWFGADALIEDYHEWPPIDKIFNVPFL